LTRISHEKTQQEYFSFAELAQRWRCSRGTVYNRLRTVGAKVLDFAPRGKKGKKVVGAATVYRIEEEQTRRFH
jgi:transcriptional antiterminator